MFKLSILSPADIQLTCDVITRVTAAGLWQEYEGCAIVVRSCDYDTLADLAYDLRAIVPDAIVTYVGGDYADVTSLVPASFA